LADLRSAGLGATCAFGDRSLKAQLRTANKSGAAFALILGEEEVRAGQVVVRDMAKGEQRTVALEEVVAWLRSQGL